MCFALTTTGDRSLVAPARHTTIYQIDDLDGFGPNVFAAALVVEVVVIGDLAIPVGSALAVACIDCGSFWLSMGRYTSIDDLRYMKLLAAMHVFECPATAKLRWQSMFPVS